MSPFSLEAKRWGLKKEGTRLTAETTATKWLSVDPGSEISHRLELLEDKGLRGIKAAYPSHSGVKVTDGKVTAPVRTSNFGEFLQMLLGNPSSAEQSVVTVEAGVNDKIDLAEDGGAAVAATLTAGSYPVGASSATAGTFCKLVKDQLEAANGADTYTVAYDTATRKFTITKSAGVFVLQWNTGTNKATSARALLGFNDADTASAIAATSDVAVANRVHKHTYLLPSGVQPPTYTFFIDRSLGVKKYNGVAVKKMMIKGNADGFVQHDTELLGLDEATGDIGSPVYTDEATPLTFQHVAVKLGGAAMTNVKEWSLSLDSGLFAKRNPGSQVAVDVLAPARMKIEGSLTVYFEDETERAKFIANTTNYLQFLIQGDTLAGTTKEAVDINLYKIAYKAFPYGDLDGLLGAQATFEAVYSVTDGKLVQVDLTNKVASY
jgi:hypothetical protein